MPRCEDFPCCGHEDAGCPDEKGRFPCVSCGNRIPRNARSQTLCSPCLRPRRHGFHMDLTGQDQEAFQ
jgi:hypothetical protein